MIDTKNTTLKGAIIGIAIAAVIFVGFMLYQQNTAGDKANYGDTVTMVLSMKFAGNGTVAAEAGSAKLKIGDGAISAAFDKNIIGMKAGGTKTFTLKAEDAFGKYSFDLIRQYPKFNTFNRTMVVPMREIRATTTSQYTVAEGETIRTTEWPWPLKILKIELGDATIYHDPRLDSLYLDPFVLVWPVKVVGLTNETVTIEQMPKIGSMLDDENFGRGRVIGIEAGKVTVDFNKPLAGNDITFEVQIESIQKPI